MTYPRELNRLCKWRSILVGRILGTRSADDPVARGYRDLFDKLLILRAEQSALTRLLIERDIFTAENLQEAVEAEAVVIEQQYQDQFPGFKATDTGMDIDMAVARQTMAGWPL